MTRQPSTRTPARRAATAIVPTLGRSDALARLLQSLAAQSVEVQIVVIDNGSPGHGVRRICDAHPAVSRVRFDRNVGYTRAVNEGARRADGDVLVLVNDDCTCEPRFVEELLAALAPAAGATMAAGVLLEPDVPQLIDTAGIEVDHTLMVMDHLNGEPLEALERAPDPLGPSGAAAAYDREAFVAAGGFDERIFAYWEEVDLALRLRSEGMRCVLARRARGRHEHSATLGVGSKRKNYLMGFGRGYMLRKWGVLTPSRTGPVIAREVMVCLAQAAMDRNLAGVAGRIDGLRTASPTERYPEDLAGSGWHTSPVGQLRRRLARRRRLRQRT